MHGVGKAWLAPDELLVLALAAFGEPHVSVRARGGDDPHVAGRHRDLGLLEPDDGDRLSGDTYGSRKERREEGAWAMWTHLKGVPTHRGVHGQVDRLGGLCYCRRLDELGRFGRLHRA